MAASQALRIKPQRLFHQLTHLFLCFLKVIYTENRIRVPALLQRFQGASRWLLKVMNRRNLLCRKCDYWFSPTFEIQIYSPICVALTALNDRGIRFLRCLFASMANVKLFLILFWIKRELCFFPGTVRTLSNAEEYLDDEDSDQLFFIQPKEL